jgi:hypothetical protein
LCIVGGYTAPGYSNGFQCALMDPSGKLGPFNQMLYFGNLSVQATLATARAWHAGALVKDQILALSGGNSSPPVDIEGSAAYYVSGTQADKFVQKIANAFTGGARSYMSTVLIGTGLYVLGGSPTTGATLRLDAAALNASLTPVPGSDLKVARYASTVYLAGNQVYLVGGTGSGGLASIETATLK